jgi:hypothetical protein
MSGELVGLIGKFWIVVFAGAWFSGFLCGVAFGMDRRTPNRGDSR